MSSSGRKEEGKGRWQGRQEGKGREERKKRKGCEGGREKGKGVEGRGWHGVCVCVCMQRWQGWQGEGGMHVQGMQELPYV